MTIGGGFGAIEPFALERWFARYEFSVRHNLGASDVEALSLGELLAMADDETRAMWDNLRLSYTESAGMPALREAIASLYARAVPDDIQCFAGAEEAIFVAMHALVRAGDHVVALTPAYQSLHEIARAIGANVTPFALSPDDGWAFDVDKLAACLTTRTTLVIVNFPHSPTGALPSRDDFRRLVELCESRGIRLLSDEVYRFLEFEEPSRLDSAVDISDSALSVGVMSKSFAMPGARIGWIATHDRALLARMAALKDYTTICNAGPSEVLSLIALRAKDRVLARSRALVRHNLEIADALFARNAGRLSWVRPRAGSVAFPRVIGESADILATRAIESEGVLILPASTFGYDASRFRIGLGRSGFEAGVAAFERALRRGG